MIQKAVTVLTNDELDFFVAKAEGIPFMRDNGGHTLEIGHDKKYYGRTSDEGRMFPFSPTNDWRIAGPIITRVRISIQQLGDLWVADMGREFSAVGPTPLVAAMRALVISHFGHTVNLD